jgi:hypothetical protein
MPKILKRLYFVIGFIWSIYGIFSLEKVGDGIDHKFGVISHMVNIIINIFLWPLNIIAAVLFHCREDLLADGIEGMAELDDVDWDFSKL